MFTRPEKKALNACPLFRNVSPAVLRYLADNPPPRLRYAAGATIMSPTDFSSNLFLIVSGGAAVTKEAKNILLNRLHAGDLFGAATLFASEPVTKFNTLVVAKRSTTLLQLDQPTLEALIRLDPTVGINYIRFLSDRIRFLNERVDSFTVPNSERRVAQYLATVARNKGEEAFPINKKEVAARLSISRASLYRAITTLQQRGVIAVENGLIRVIAPPPISDGE